MFEHHSQASKAKQDEFLQSYSIYAMRDTYSPTTAQHKSFSQRRRQLPPLSSHHHHHPHRTKATIMMQAADDSAVVRFSQPPNAQRPG